MEAKQEEAEAKREALFEQAAQARSEVTSNVPVPDIREFQINVLVGKSFLTFNKFIIEASFILGALVLILGIPLFYIITDAGINDYHSISQIMAENHGFIGSVIAAFLLLPLSATSALSFKFPFNDYVRLAISYVPLLIFIFPTNGIYFSPHSVSVVIHQVSAFVVIILSQGFVLWFLRSREQTKRTYGALYVPIAGIIFGFAFVLPSMFLGEVQWLRPIYVFFECCAILSLFYSFYFGIINTHIAGDSFLLAVNMRSIFADVLTGFGYCILFSIVIGIFGYILEFFGCIQR